MIHGRNDEFVITATNHELREDNCKTKKRKTEQEEMKKKIDMTCY